MAAVIGAGSSRDYAPPAVVAVKAGPQLETPRIFNTTTANLQHALEQRVCPNTVRFRNLPRDARGRIIIPSDIQDKLFGKRNPDGTVARESLSNHLCGFVDASKHYAFLSTKKIDEWCKQAKFKAYKDGVYIDDCKSAKWDTERYERWLTELTVKEEGYKMTGGVKKEHYSAGKHPRPLIAQGDAGCTMASVIFRCFEDLQFKHFDKGHVKGEDKCSILPKQLKAARHTQAQLDALGAQNAFVIEGDGSAWDATCSSFVRQFENSLLKHVGKQLIKNGVLKQEWAEAHMKACEAKFVNVRAKQGKEDPINRIISFIIDAIRLSGWRGTGSCNWCVNKWYWSAVVLAEPHLLGDTTQDLHVDVWGGLRTWRDLFEGDDSSITTAGQVDLAEHEDEVCARWASMGFNMKIMVRKPGDAATFVGCRFATDKFGPTGVWCPEIGRGLKTCSTSWSTEAVMAWRAGDKSALHRILAAKNLSRAMMCRHFAPLAAHLHFTIAEGFAATAGYAEPDRDDLYNVGALSTEDVQDAMHQVLASLGNPDTYIHLAALGYDVTPEEAVTVAALHPSTFTALDDDAFRHVVPTTWR